MKSLAHLLLTKCGVCRIFIPVQTHMNFSEIEHAKGFPAQFASSLSRSLQNIPQVLRHTLSLRAFTMKRWAVHTALVLLASQAIAASFDCSKASTYAEKEICADSLLQRLDVALAQNYKGMLASDFGGSKKALREEQLRWISQRNKCTSTKCLIDAYRKRLDETCDYGVVTGVHPECTLSEDIK